MHPIQKNLKDISSESGVQGGQVNNLPYWEHPNWQWSLTQLPKEIVCVKTTFAFVQPKPKASCINSWLELILFGVALTLSGIIA